MSQLITYNYSYPEQLNINSRARSQYINVTTACKEPHSQINVESPLYYESTTVGSAALPSCTGEVCRDWSKGDGRLVG